jgi:hypothetical protein
MTPEPGIYPGVPFSDYMQWDAVNNSLLSVLINKSPAHAKLYKEEPPDTDALRFGHALHTRALEPQLYPERYAIRPECDRRTKEGKAIYEDFLATLDGKTELTQAENDSIEAICASIEKNRLHRWIERGKYEVCIVWRDARTGLLCKARLDYYHDTENVIVDLKSTIDASYDGFAKSIFNFDYYQQAAWYCDGIKTLKGDTPSFVFLAVEKKPPYACAAYEAADEMLIAGRKTYRKALALYQECMATNHWPGYPDRVEIITMPQWALNRLGVGQYNLITEDEDNGPAKYNHGTIETDWDELEREARESE